MRLRDFGVVPGWLPTGPLNAMTDVPGVRVGHVTCIEGEGPLEEGVGPIRTGVTAIVPHGGSLFRDKVAAGVCSLNGFGKAAGFEQIRERGTLETPIILTNTLNVGRAADALVGYMLRDHPEIGLRTGTVNPVVAECNDGFLNDLRGRHIGREQVWAAIDGAAEGPVAEGCVGAGTGTACYQFKGGIGTASRRVLDGQFTVSALVQTNMGRRAELRVLGAPIGARLAEQYLPEPGAGSIIMVLATDAPLSALQLRRLATRGALGLARTGAISGDQSGDFVIAFSTTNRSAHAPAALVEQAARVNDNSAALDAFFLAAVESVEEAILNALVAATTMTGRDGHILHALPHDALAEWLAYYRLIEQG
ncbi:MAG TPA: P1 family peptidase [Candidatus Limnocylindrales bacterium]|nr:P1 family peptidase [Candidatus Limnocylindrales bacterium]